MIKPAQYICKRLLLITLLVIVISACSSKTDTKLDKDDTPVVSVHGRTLYLSDLNNAIPAGLNTADSTQAADAYIKMWVKEELIYEKAKQNVTDQSEIDEMVENYRQSLTTFTYMEQLLKEELSKKITDNELKSYYDKNPDSFELESCLIKGLFLKIPQSSTEVRNFRQWYQSNTDAAKEKIEKASYQNAVIYDYFYDKWINFDDISSNIPISISDQAQFVKNNKNFETEDSLYVYFLHIEEYALPGTKAPYEYSKPEITDILINKHRETFLQTLEQDLLNKAIENDEVKYYQDKNQAQKKK
ncbi:hypothetical protein [Dysgonomonas macrotermitis]|uniref:Peptidyl-prolyl cis-trans isomerase n=1 Tax=Dysgonomonas macrotermitis TaxID=1346286 RepID=A0A1M4TRV5_9BACT|nr:hypothetical protein [Dysgonomonas macrotermitis]SHE47134.1 hypothetical protein SAMN05444362_101400 [Dysgonomonas macrotermitis]